MSGLVSQAYRQAALWMTKCGQMTSSGHDCCGLGSVDAEFAHAVVKSRAVETQTARLLQSGPPITQPVSRKTFMMCSRSTASSFIGPWS